MRVGTGITISALCAREVVRALLVPWHLLCYLPQRRRWRREAADVLAQPPAAASTALAREFGKRARGGGRIFISAGEVSGESHAAKVVQAVRARGGAAQWTCFGGPTLEAAGARLLYPLSDRAVMGVTGVLASLPFLLGAVARFIRMLDDEPPDLVVLVDYPGLHLVLARLARRRGVDVIHYIAPQYWAWAPWRMHRYKRSFSATLTILPFEPTFFRRAGIPSEYVGHPLLDQVAAVPWSGASATRAPAEGVPAKGTTARGTPAAGTPAAGTPAEGARSSTLCLLPGSRRGEIRANLPGMIAVARAVRAAHPGAAGAAVGAATVVLPHVDARHADLIRSILAAHGAGFVEFRVGPIGPVLANSRVVLAKSGTGSLESCLHETPTVVVYKLGGIFSALFTRHFLSVPWIASANLIAGRQVVPEFCFHENHRWRDVSAAVVALWKDSPERRECLAGIAEVRHRLGPAGASERVARWIEPFCQAAP